MKFALLFLLIATAQARPNFIFVLTDDMGYGDIGVYGSTMIDTPAIDALAANGVRFTQGYVAAAVCSPSRAAFMTGRFPAEVGVHAYYGSPDHNAAAGQTDFLDPAYPTVTSLLQAAGYHTAHYGKWHLSTRWASAAPPPPEAYGIDEHATITSAATPQLDDGQPYFWARSSEMIVDKTIDFIERNGEPFFVNVWMLIPHATLNPTADQAAPYDDLSPSGVPERGANTIYAASVTDMDAQIGRLTQYLSDAGLADNTVVIFASDNGPEVVQSRNASHAAAGNAGPFRGRKRSLYEGGIRMPFIFSWPGQFAARVDTESVIAAVDLLPTVAALAGVKPPSVNGEDISDILMGGPRPRHGPLFWREIRPIMGDVINKSPVIVMRDGDYKLLINPDLSRVEYYDLSKSTLEVDNLARGSIYAATAQQIAMQNAALAWHAAQGGNIHPLAGSQ